MPRIRKGETRKLPDTLTEKPLPPSKMTAVKKVRPNKKKKNPLIGKPTGVEYAGYMVMRRMMNLILMGYDDDYIIAKMVEDFGSSEIQMRRYLKAATCALDDRNREWEKTIVKKNFLRLDAIVDECYQKGKYKELLQAIDLQNKLAGAYETKIRFETPIFEIKIGNENDAEEKENNEPPTGRAEVIGNE